jgi:hypothetical protein
VRVGGWWSGRWPEIRPIPGSAHLPVGQVSGHAPAGSIKGPIHIPLVAVLAPRGGDALRTRLVDYVVIGYCIFLVLIKNVHS